jgi:hypothetical protein
MLQQAQFYSHGMYYEGFLTISELKHTEIYHNFWHVGNSQVK